MSSTWQEAFDRSAHRAPRTLGDDADRHPHLPLTFVIADLVRPRLVVQVGPGGDALAGWAQSVEELRTGGRVVGVSTGAGAGAGTQGGTVETAGPDEAAERVSGRVIDVLHVTPPADDESIRVAEAVMDSAERVRLVVVDGPRPRGDAPGNAAAWERLSPRGTHRVVGVGDGVGLIAPGGADDAAVAEVMADDARWDARGPGLESAGELVRLTGLARAAASRARDRGLDPRSDDARDVIAALETALDAQRDELERRGRHFDDELAYLRTSLAVSKRANDHLRKVNHNLVGENRDVHRTLGATLDEVVDAHAQLAEARQLVHDVTQSTSWKLTAFLRKRRQAPPPAPAPPAIATSSPGDRVSRPVDERDAYERRLELFPEVAVAESDAQVSIPDGPVISVIVPVYNPPVEFLRRAIESVHEQIYPHWELCLANDASTDPEVREVLDQAAASDPRVKVVHRESNGHICASSNSALGLATGEWIALLDHDDELVPEALLAVAQTIGAEPRARLVYSDEDKLDGDGNRFFPFFKPPFDRRLLLGQNFVCHLLAAQRALVEQVGGFVEGYEGSQDHDLVLRMSEVLGDDEIVHIPRILYRWRAIEGSTSLAHEAKPYARHAAQAAVEDHMERVGLRGEVTRDTTYGYNRVRLAHPDPLPSVSIIIPTHNGADLVRQCVDSIRAGWDYPGREVIVVDNQSDEDESLQYMADLERLPGFRVLRFDEEFNFARLNNFAAERAEGELLVLLNNDTEVVSPDWLHEMAAWAVRPEVGTVGARLLYPDGTFQHGGVVLGVGGVASHEHTGLPGDSPGYMGRALLVHDVDGNTGACLMVRASLYHEINGMDERLAVAFNDVDFCLRVEEAGYANVWTPHATLIHHESKSRGLEDNDAKMARFKLEQGYMMWRWPDRIRADRHYNPNLTHENGTFDLALPPRIAPMVVPPR